MTLTLLLHNAACSGPEAAAKACPAFLEGPTSSQRVPAGGGGLVDMQLVMAPLTQHSGGLQASAAGKSSTQVSMHALVKVCTCPVQLFAGLHPVFGKREGG